MIRRRLSALSLMLSFAFLAEPCLAIADSHTKKPPQKPTSPPPPPTTPSHTSRGYKYQSLDKYHPHAKSGSKSRHSSHGNT